MDLTEAEQRSLDKKSMIDELNAIMTESPNPFESLPA
jgi:hypothetical protein